MDNDPEQSAPESDANEQPHFLDDPDVREAFGAMLREFAVESDRGAVLIAADIVAAHLAIVIRELAPPDFTQRRIRDLLSYPGMLSTLAARSDLARMAGFIQVSAHQSISALRSLRNHAAHSQSGFRLKEHVDILRKISDLGPGVAFGVNQFATESVLTSYFEALLERGRESEVEYGRNLFPDRATILEELRSRPDAMATLEERALRTELAFAIWLLLGAIADYRKRRKVRSSA